MRPIRPMRIPFRKCFSINSAVLLKATQEIKSASCCPSLRKRRSTARVNRATVVPPSEYRTSGSLVNLPTSCTLFMTFRELSDLWLTNEKVGSVKEQSITVIKSRLKTINSYIGDIKVKNLKQSHIEEFRKVLIESGKVDRYNKCLSTIRAIIKYAVHKDIMAKDITGGMSRVNYHRKERRSLTQEERDLIEKADLNEFEYCLANLLLYTGLRKSEALALNVSDIDLKKRKINVCKTLVSSKSVTDCLQDYPKTKAGKRQVPIPMPLYPILKDYISHKDGILFPSKYGSYIGLNYFFRRWKQFINKLQAVSDKPLPDDITAHTFRHTYASDLYKAGVDIKQAQYLLGHDSYPSLP